MFSILNRNLHACICKLIFVLEATTLCKLNEIPSLHEKFSNSEEMNNIVTGTCVQNFKTK